MISGYVGDVFLPLRKTRPNTGVCLSGQHIQQQPLPEAYLEPCQTSITELFCKNS